MSDFAYRKQQDLKFRQKTDELLKELPKFVSTYVNGIEGYTSPSSVHTYVRKLSVFFKYADDSLLFDVDDIRKLKFEDLCALNAEDIEAFTHYLRIGGASGEKQQVKENSINNYLGALSSLWSYGLSHGYLKHNVIKDVKRKKKLKKEVVALDEEQTKTVIQSIETGSTLTKHQQKVRTGASAKRDEAIYLMLVKTGLRVSELVGIDVDDLDLKNHSVKVMRKEEKEQTVYFSDSVEEAIKEYLSYRKELMPNSNALFLVTVGKYKGERLSVRSVESIVRKYSDGAVPELYGKVSAHKLRSTFATQMIEKTGDLSLTQQLLSHESPSTTSQYISKRKSLESHRNDLE